MTDRERVVKGLEKVRENAGCAFVNDCVCETCPYVDVDGCWKRVILDAISLLKAQEDTRLVPRTPYHTKVAYKHSDEIVYWITDQCPECVERGELGIWDTLVDRYGKYCRRCGQALDWSEYDGRDQIDWDEYTSHVSERAERFLRRKGRYMSDG